MICNTSVGIAKEFGMFYVPVAQILVVAVALLVVFLPIAILARKR
jgi:hypothetical protein